MDHQSVLRRIFLLGLLVVAPGLAQAMEHFVRPLQDQNGRAIAGATVSVYIAGSTTLATIYSDAAGTVSANPITTGVDGMMHFYAVNGLYDLVPVAKGYVFNLDQYKHLALVDPNDVGGGPPGSCIRAVATDSDTILSSDSGCILVYSNSGIVSVVLPQAGTAGFGTNFNVTLLNASTGQVIVSPAVSTIQGGDTLTLSAGQSTDIRSDGTNYHHAPGLTTPLGWPSSDANKEIAWATSESSAERVGDGTRKVLRWCDATDGCLEKPDPLGDTFWRIWPNFSGCIRDMEANGGLGANVLCIDPDATNPLDMFVFQSGYYPLGSFFIPAGFMDGDGTHCPAVATSVTINSGPKIPTFICADNSGATLHATVPLPPDYVAGTTLKVRAYVVQTAADTGSVLGDVSSQCRANAETISSTWGTAAAIDLVNTTGSNAVNWFEGSPMTPAGTCTPNDLLSLRYVFDAASTSASATLHFVGFQVFYSKKGLSH